MRTRDDAEDITLPLGVLKSRIARLERQETRSPLRLVCDAVDVIPYRDLLEFYLWLSGARDWRWVDSAGGTAEKQNVLVSLRNLLADGARWLPWIAAERIRIRRLAREARRALKTAALSPILFLRSDHWFNLKSGGSVGHLRGVIEELRASAHETYVVSTDGLAGIPQDDHFLLVKPDGADARNLPELAQVLFSQTMAEAASARWGAWKPALVYQRASLGNYTGVLLKARHRVPLVCEYNGSFTWMADHWDTRPLLHRGLIHRIEMLNLNCADALIVVSRALKEELTRRGVAPGKVLVNPNGVDTVRYSPAAAGGTVRKCYALEDQTVIGFIGTFGPWHGAEVLAEAFVSLIRQHPADCARVRLLLIGDGAGLAQVRRILEQGDIPGKWTLTGAVAQDDGPAYLAACDVLVAPQIPNPDGTPFFGSPTKLFEYMAMGKAIVASRLEQIGEILEDGRDALLVEPGNAPDLARALLLYVRDAPMRMAHGEEARLKAIREFTWQAHTARITVFLEHLKEMQ